MTLSYWIDVQKSSTYNEYKFNKKTQRHTKIIQKKLLL